MATLTIDVPDALIEAYATARATARQAAIPGPRLASRWHGKADAIKRRNAAADAEHKAWSDVLDAARTEANFASRALVTERENAAAVETASAG